MFRKILILFVALLAFAHEARSIETLGVCTHFALKRTNLNQAIPLIQRLGFNSVRDDIYWDYVESKPGRFSLPPHITTYVDGVTSAGLGLVVPLGYGNRMLGISKPDTDAERKAYNQYVSYVVGQLKGKPGIVYEVWNEWDRKTGGVTEGKIDDYIQLMESVIPVIKKADPAARIIVGGFSSKAPLADWLEKVVASSSFSQVDGVSFHPYVHFKNGRNSSAEAMFELVKSVEARLKKVRNGKQVDIYLTELGWTSFGNVPQAYVADQVAKSIMLLSALPYVKGLWLYDLQNDGNRRGDPEDNFGIVDYDGNPKDSFLSVQDSVSIIRSVGDVKLVSGSSGYIWAGKKKGQKGLTVVYWGGNKRGVSITSQDLGGKDKEVRLLGKGNSPMAFKATVQRGRQHGKLTMSDSPQIIDIDSTSFDVVDDAGKVVERVVF